MTVVLHRNFEKRYTKLRKNDQKRCKQQLLIFSLDPYDPVLNNHALRGRYIGYRSINIAGDLRAVYRLLSADTALFTTVDTHSNLYE